MCTNHVKVVIVSKNAMKEMSGAYNNQENSYGKQETQEHK